MINNYINDSIDYSFENFVDDIEELVGKDYGFLFKKTIYRVKK